LAPNTEATFGACKPVLESFLNEELGGRSFNLEHNDDPRSRFGVTIRLEEPLDLATVAAP
jgi:hypothetical protein